MPSTVFSAATLGIDAYPVHVEVDTDRTLPTFTVVGLPDSTVRESKERVLAAIKNAGYQWPRRRVTVNLAPADRRKEGSAFDLPTADGPLIYGVSTLQEAVEILEGDVRQRPYELNVDDVFREHGSYPVDFSEVRGQDHAKRALEVAAAGGHHLLMVGPPGSGKTMLARRLPTILPAPTLPEALATTKIHSVAGILAADQALVATRPFRTPHHTISELIV